MEVGVIYPTHEIDGVEYVFLGREDKGAGGEGAGGECGCCESWLCVCRRRKSDLVDDGLDEFSGYGWERHPATHLQTAIASNHCLLYQRHDSQNDDGSHDDDRQLTARVSRFGNWKLRRGLRRSFSRCGLARNNVTPRVNQRQARAPRTPTCPTCLLLERCGQTLTFGFYAALGRGFAIHYINFRWHHQSTLSTVVQSLCQLFVKGTI